MVTVKEYFDSNASSYVHEDNKRIKELLDSLNLSSCKRILDLGAGKGIISTRLADLSNGEVIALDVSPKMLSYAPKDKRVKYVNEDFYNYKDEPFDAIVCFDAYPHFLDKEKFVNKTIELLNSGGFLAIIHDIGRNELNTHHKQFALKISTMLKPVEEETKPFLDAFEIVSLEENDKIYKIVLRKK